MMRRSRAREVALQLLFWQDLNPQSTTKARTRFVAERLRDKALEPFALRLANGVLEHQSRIDALLSQAAENWRLPRMAAVDRNVLRMGVFELIDPEAESPAPVAINEAIELARRFGTADSPAFVNGVLDKVRTAIVREDSPEGTSNGASSLPETQ